MPYLLAVAGLLLILGLKNVKTFVLKTEGYLKYNQMVRKYADLFGIPQPLFLAIVEQESYWDPNSYRQEPKLKVVDLDPNDNVVKYDYDGSYGLVQILFSTAKWMGYTGDAQGLYDPDTNLYMGARYLASIMKQYSSYEDIFSVYNSGRPYAKAPASTLDYVVKIKERLTHYV